MMLESVALVKIQLTTTLTPLVPSSQLLNYDTNP